MNFRSTTLSNNADSFSLQKTTNEKETEGKITCEENKDKEEKVERRERKCDGEIRSENRRGMRDGEEGKRGKMWEWRRQMKKIWRERLEMKKEN